MAMDKIYFRVKGFRNRNDNILPRKLNFNPTAVASCDASIFFEKVEDLFLITGYPVVRCHAKMKHNHFFLKCKHLRSSLKYQLDSSCVIMSLILMTTLLYEAVIL